MEMCLRNHSSVLLVLTWVVLGFTDNFPNISKIWAAHLPKIFQSVFSEKTMIVIIDTMLVQGPKH